MHVQSGNIRMQTMSVHWLRAFVEISGTSLFPYISGILAAILPNLSYEAEDITRKDVTQQEHKRKFITLFDTQSFEIMIWIKY